MIIDTLNRLMTREFPLKIVYIHTCHTASQFNVTCIYNTPRQAVCFFPILKPLYKSDVNRHLQKVWSFESEKYYRPPMQRVLKLLKVATDADLSSVLADNDTTVKRI